MPSKDDNDEWVPHVTLMCDVQLPLEDSLTLFKKLDDQHPDEIRHMSPAVTGKGFNPHYGEHKIIVRGPSRKRLAVIEPAEVYSFSVKRSGENVFDWSFKAKGRVDLDGQSGCIAAWMDLLATLEIVGPKQSEMDLEENAA